MTFNVKKEHFPIRLTVNTNETKIIKKYVRHKVIVFSFYKHENTFESMEIPTLWNYILSRALQFRQRKRMVWKNRLAQ